MWLAGNESPNNSNSNNNNNNANTNQSRSSERSSSSGSSSTLAEAASSRLTTGGASQLRLAAAGDQQQQQQQQQPHDNHRHHHHHHHHHHHQHQHHQNRNPEQRKPQQHHHHLSPANNSDNNSNNTSINPAKIQSSSSSSSSSVSASSGSAAALSANPQQPASAAAAAMSTIGGQQQQQQQQRASGSSRISFYLKTSIFTRKVTVDTDKMALGLIKQLAIGFLNELYFQQPLPASTYIGDYIKNYYSSTDNLNHLYDRLILRLYQPDRDSFVPFNSVSDIQPDSFISVEVGERARHLLSQQQQQPAPSSTNFTTASGSQHQQQQHHHHHGHHYHHLPFTNHQQPAVAAAAAAGPSLEFSLQAADNNPFPHHHQHSISSAQSTSSSLATVSSVTGSASSSAVNSTPLAPHHTTNTNTNSSQLSKIRMKHDFKQETFLLPTFCASCSDFLKGILRQGFQCKICKKNYCRDCKARAELPGSSDSCLAPISNNLNSNSNSNLNNNNSITVNSNSNQPNNLILNQAAPISAASSNVVLTGASNNSSFDMGSGSQAAAATSGNKLDVAAHTNMAKRKSASNLLQHFNLANPFKTHHNNNNNNSGSSSSGNQPQQQAAAKEDKSKSARGSTGALEPVLMQLSKQREQQSSTSGASSSSSSSMTTQPNHSSEVNNNNNTNTNNNNNSGSGSGSGGNNPKCSSSSLVVAQATHMSSSHQNLYMNANGVNASGGGGGCRGPNGSDDPTAAASMAASSADDAAGLKKLSNSARSSATDLHSPTRRDQANHTFGQMDSASLQLAAAAAGEPGKSRWRCDVCSKSLLAAPGGSAGQLQQQQQPPMVCKSCKLLVHSHCQTLILTDCMSRIAESSRAAAQQQQQQQQQRQQSITTTTGGGDGGSPTSDGGLERPPIKGTNSNLSRDNIRLHRLAPSVKHVKRPDSTKPIIEGWLRHTTLSDEQARRHYWRLDETDITLYENDTSTRYFKAIALNKITRVMSSQSLPKQIREGVLQTSPLAAPNKAPPPPLTVVSPPLKQQGSISGGGGSGASEQQQQQQSSGKTRSANASPIKSPELLAQMRAMFAFELATGSMYLVQAGSELEASKWRESLATVTGKTDQPQAKAAPPPPPPSAGHPSPQKSPADKQQQQPPTAVAASAAASAAANAAAAAPADKLVESINLIDLQQEDKLAAAAAAAAVAAPKQPRQPAVQRQHHHRYPPSGHRQNRNFTDPNRSRLYNRPRKTIKLDKMDIPDHLIEAKYLIERDRIKGVGFEELGSGQFGKVYAAIGEYKAVDADKGLWSGVPVAIKEISKSRFDLRQQAKLKNEANILSGLDHPGVIILERVHDLPDKIYIVMEQLEDDMLEMIVSTERKRLDERVTKFLTYQILEALKYLHAQKIAHCDLKPENVLLVERKHTFPQIKLCDFGFAKIIEENSFRSSLVGTPAYLAPEVVKGERYNRSVDLWSVGVIVYVSLSGEFPFNEGENITDQISRANFMYPDQPWSEISQQAKSFINSLLRVNCEKRLSASTAQMDVWIQDYQLWCDLCDLELRVGRRWVTDDADFDRWSRYAKEHGLRVPNSAIQLHESLISD